MRRPRAFGALPGASLGGHGRFGPVLDRPGPGGQVPLERPCSGQRPVRSRCRFVQAAPCAQHRRRGPWKTAQYPSTAPPWRKSIRCARAIRGCTSWPELIGLGLVIGGGIGNAIDRFALGYVVDFIDLSFMDFPVFNIADIGVTCGLALFLIGWIVRERHHEEVR